MSKTRLVQRRYSLCRALLILFYLGAAPAALASVLFSDDFEDGVVDGSVYTAMGDAILEESGGKLRVTVSSCEDGVRINAPPGAMAIDVTKQIDKAEFDVLEALSVRTMVTDNMGSDEFALIDAQMGRPFWNFCKYTITLSDGTTQDIGILCGRGLSQEQCPQDDTQIRVDWLPPAAPGGPDRLVYQTRKAAGQVWRFGKTRDSTLQHTDGSVGAYTITFTGVNQDLCDD